MSAARNRIALDGRVAIVTGGGSGTAMVARLVSDERSYTKGFAFDLSRGRADY